MHHTHLRTARHINPTRIVQNPAKISPQNPMRNAINMEQNSDQEIEVVRNPSVKELQKDLAVNVQLRTPAPASAPTAETEAMNNPVPVRNFEVETAREPNFFIYWMKKILSTFLPFYWIIVVIGILGFLTLIIGIFIGAFICNGSSSLPFFFRMQSRVARVRY